MKIKHKIGFVALITLLDVIVIVFVVMNNNKTSINNDISNKTAANIVKNVKADKPKLGIIDEEPKEELHEETKNEETTEETKTEEITTEKSPKEEIVEITEEGNILNNSKEETVVESTQTVETSQVVENTNVSYDEMSIEEREAALYNGTLKLVYSEVYTNSSDRLTKSRGALYFNGHKETYYSERVLPGASLNIPGRHVADDGTVRDGDGYICVAASYDYLPKGSIVLTSLGPAKVYDTGCAYGTIDIYVNW